MPKPNAGCPIHRYYRTTSAQAERRLSDSSVLSDNERSRRTADVRFIGDIGQLALTPNAGCPIHRRYRTTSAHAEQRMSDSSVLSDNECPHRTADVRFIGDIGQRVPMPNAGCPIH
ncbi:hypothetical protein [uncultured Trichococcus sp.]|uniref:hypothetical protein n=1 Tax=uncultured Trichococcus sp. TaxID=189665 RepID=UPI0029C86D8F|nr:hypothetical protein [uncultured Trichococcus sp.]